MCWSWSAIWKRKKTTQLVNRALVGQHLLFWHRYNFLSVQKWLVHWPVLHENNDTLSELPLQSELTHLAASGNCQLPQTTGHTYTHVRHNKLLVWSCLTTNMWLVSSRLNNTLRSPHTHTPDAHAHCWQLKHELLVPNFELTVTPWRPQHGSSTTWEGKGPHSPEGKFFLACYDWTPQRQRD